MKTYKLFSLIIIFTLLCVGYVLAQKATQDSIHIRIDKSMDISISIYSDKNLQEEIARDLETLKSMLGENQNISDFDSYYIAYIPESSITIKPSEPVKLIMVDKGEKIHFDFNNQCEIKGSSYNLLLKFNKSEDLFSEDLSKKIANSLTAKKDNTSRFKTIYKYDHQGNEINSDIFYNTKEAQMDAILLYGGIGTSLIRNQPITDISAEIDFTFTKKGVWKNQYYLSYNAFFNFDENRNAFSNSFLNLGYRHNLSNTTVKSNWIGVEVGYLISKHGDFFDENTFKFGINWRAAKYVSIAPQIFVSGNLEHVYPGLRVGFGF